MELCGEAELKYYLVLQSFLTVTQCVEPVN